MAIPALLKTLAETKLAEYCEQRVPEHARSKIRLSFKSHSNSITLSEERPRIDDHSKSTTLSVAQFRFDPQTSKWTLYCADRNSRWHKAIESGPQDKIERLLRHVDRDVTGIFWG